MEISCFNGFTLRVTDPWCLLFAVRKRVGRMRKYLAESLMGGMPGWWHELWHRKVILLIFITSKKEQSGRERPWPHPPGGSPCCAGGRSWWLPHISVPCSPSPGAYAPLRTALPLTTSDPRFLTVYLGPEQWMEGVVLDAPCLISFL